MLAYERNSPQEDVPLYPDTLFWLLVDQSLLLLQKAANTNFYVFDLTRSGIEPTTFRYRGEHANHYTTEAVKYVLHYILKCVKFTSNGHVL